MEIVLTVALVGLAMIGIELWKPGRSWPSVRGWWLRAILLNSGQVASSWLAGLTWDHWMSDLKPFDASGLGSVGGAVVGYLAITFVFYWWHRWRHEVPILWRLLHQVHHSPQRLEIITSFYKHPLEIVSNGIISSAVLTFLCGLNPTQIVGAVVLSGFAELFYHWNVKTPHWLGYIIQRPESHCVHHQEGLHKWNYGDLPLWDMLFGTFRNPPTFDGRCGFGDKELELWPMLMFRDVNPESTSNITSETSPGMASPSGAESGPASPAASATAS